MSGRVILDRQGVAAGIDTMARAILAGGRDLDRLALIGVRRRGVPIAQRIAGLIEAREGRAPRCGILDITLYRDDLTLVAEQPVVSRTEIEFPVDGLRVVLMDDVLFTGRTVRAAIDALFALGRPAKIELAVLIDRGHRELPIEANFVGQRLETTLNEVVKVHLDEIDERDAVEIVTMDGAVK